MTGSQFLILREAYISILSLVLSLEPFEKFVVMGGGWSKVILVSSLSFNQYTLGYCQTPDLGLGLGVDFTFPYNNNNNNNNKNNPHLIFHRREGTRGLKFGTQT